MNVRRAMYETLYDILYKKSYSNIKLNQIISSNVIEEKDINLLTETIYGVLENLYYLDRIIENLSKIKLKKIDKSAMIILRISIYHYYFLDRIPEYAIVNEANKLANKHSRRAKPFINGSLRSMMRSPEIVSKINYNSYEEELSIKKSCPMWLIEYLSNDFDFNFIKDYLEFSAIKNEINIRVNNLKITNDELMKKLDEKNIEYKVSSIYTNSIKVYNIKNIENWDLYKEGLITIQDLSSQIVSLVVNPKSENILDMCAGIGGKTTHLSDIMNNEGLIIAEDIYQNKLNILNQNAKRLDANNIKTQLVEDSTNNKFFDKILIDAPCTGLGVISKKPEIKLFIKRENIDNLIKIQYELLNKAKNFLKTGGTIIYSTCSINLNENKHQINRFLEENPEFERVNLKEENLLKLEETYYNESGDIEIYPNIHNIDGFFISKIKKKK